ncbi:MAG: hypothetical protein R2882_13840 [Gemmatimonadales bacterium]
MRSMFQMLQRVSGGANAGGRLPQWLSTHPDPENRIVKTDERLATLNRDLSGTKLNRPQFLPHVDGLVFGENPRNGFFEGARFNHPDLAFRIDFPTGWASQNQPTAVVAVSQQQDAIVALSIPGKDAPDQALAAFLGQQGIQSANRSSGSLNGFPGGRLRFSGADGPGPGGGPDHLRELWRQHLSNPRLHHRAELRQLPEHVRRGDLVASTGSLTRPRSPLSSRCGSGWCG